MSISQRDGVVVLAGGCGAEDAEQLLSMLQTQAGQSVDLTDAGHLHGTVIQILLAFRPSSVGGVGDEFARTWLLKLPGEA